MAKKFKMKTTAKNKEIPPAQQGTTQPSFKPVSSLPNRSGKPVQQKDVQKISMKPTAPPHEEKKMVIKKDEKPRNKQGDEFKVKVTYPKGSAGTWQERFEGILNDILNRMERIENSHTALSDEISEIRENVNELETNIHELTALYDAISAQYNPFIDLTPQERRVIGGGELQVENTVEEAGPMEAEIPEELSEELTMDLETPAEELSQAEPLEEVTPSEEFVPAAPSSKVGYILPDIPENSLSHMTAIKWTEFMLEKVGPSNIRKLLEYYRDLKWISDKVVNKILQQVHGLNTETIEAEYDTWKMSTDDHMKTLVFIEKIKGGDVGSIHAEEVQDWAEDIKRG